MRIKLARLSNWFYKHIRISVFIFGFILAMGIASYTSFLNREGFPSIQFPLVVVNGSYFVDDAQKVDADIGQPFSNAFKDDERVARITTNSSDNIFGASVVFNENVKLDDGLEIINDKINELALPEGVELNRTAIDPSGYLFEFDALLAVYVPDVTASLLEQEQAAAIIASKVQRLGEVVNAEVVSPFASAKNQFTGELQTIQTSFGRVGIPTNDQLMFHRSVIIGVNRSENADILELSRALNTKTAELNATSGTQVQTVIGADFAVQLQNDIDSLQGNLLTGILAVVLVSLLLIGWRSTFMTGLFIASVMVGIFMVMHMIGYSINTITLFALVLALGLFVDDATIIVEAIDAAAKDRKKKATEVIRIAVRKVGIASLAGTLTTVLVFLPLAFVTGVLGEFIRVLPITVVVALIVSYLMSLTLIPVIARFTFFKLRDVQEPWILRKIHDSTDTLANALGKMVRHSGRLLAAGAILLSLGVVASSSYFAQNAGFNIFPSSRDSNQIIIELSYRPNTTIEEAQAVADDLNKIITQNYSDVVTRVLYGGFRGSNTRNSDVSLSLAPYSERSVTAPELTRQLEKDLAPVAGDRARVKVRQVDAGPPADDFPFKVQIYGTAQSTKAMSERLIGFLHNHSFVLPTGDSVEVTETNLEYTDSITRFDGRQLIQVGASLNTDQTTAALTVLQEDVDDFVQAQDLAALNLTTDDITYDFGQETENSESFAALGVVFPIAIVAMFILLALQFRSFLQPLLIFLAIPFSFAGAFAALDLTNNPISFFSQVGLVGLIGIAVNNTILLTDYANQERRKGFGVRESIATATSDRFRPLLATTITTIVALLPLALLDPFWQPLAVTIIGGLISSTLLVIIAFPFYYLTTERIRELIKRTRKKIV